MWIDIVSVALRALSFIALFQAAGIVFFLAIFGAALHTNASIARLGQGSAYLGAALVLVHHFLDAGRMAGELPGVFDASLQYLSMTSSTGAANSLRVLGLALIAVRLGRRDPTSRLLCIIGAVVVCAAFLVTGHSSAHAQRWLLAPLLLLHLLVIAFWFGSLWPLVVISRREPTRTAAQIIERFSSLATALVPLIAAAGIAMAWTLVPNLSALFKPYGLLLLTKSIGFSLLLGLAAVNKWRLGPGIASGDIRARTAFRRSVTAEFVLICAVLSVTAVMTGFFSPEGE